MLVTLDDWRACEVAEDDAAPPDGPVFLGIDLGAAQSMSAAVMFWPESGRIEAMGAFAGDPSLHERQTNDGCGDAYTRLHAEGLLQVTSGRVTNLHEFIPEVAAELRERGCPEPAAVACDRERIEELRTVLDKIGLPWVLTPRGTGRIDGAEDARRFRAAVLERRLRAHRPGLLRHALAESFVRITASGDAVLLRKTGSGKARIDATQAALQAVSVGSEAPRRPQLFAFG